MIAQARHRRLLVRPRRHRHRRDRRRLDLHQLRLGRRRAVGQAGGRGPLRAGRVPRRQRRHRGQEQDAGHPGPGGLQLPAEEPDLLALRDRAARSGSTSPIPTPTWTATAPPSSPPCSGSTCRARRSSGWRTSARASRTTSPQHQRRAQRADGELLRSRRVPEAANHRRYE